MTVAMPTPGTPVTLEHLALILDSARQGVMDIGAPSDAGLAQALAFAADTCADLAVTSGPDRLDPMPEWWPRWLELRERVA